MFPFTAVEIYRGDVFAITTAGDIWHMRPDPVSGIIVQWLADTAEYYPVIRILKAKRDVC